MDQKPDDGPNSLLAAPPRIINVGLELFAVDLAAEGAAVTHVQWRPPAGGNARLAGLLDKLRG
jgi:FdrA protein